MDACSSSDKCKTTDWSDQEKNVFSKSKKLPLGTETIIAGHDFNAGLLCDLNLSNILIRTGFQATSIGLAIKEISRMLDSKERIVDQESTDYIDYGTFSRLKSGCTIFLGYTSNMVSSGLRDVIRFLVQHNMVDCLVTTAGGIEEDIIKCLSPTYLGDFHLDGAYLRKNGINRIGNLLVPNDNYCRFEDWLLPILDELLKEQNETNFRWTPSKMIRRLGQEINDEKSIYYWAYKNNIPVFCPALTDGSIGDIMYFHTYRNPGLILDILEDLRLINSTAVRSNETGLIILGGGLIKHHICNANLMRNGADYAVFVNTGNEFDGSDAGARPDESVSWGKIKPTATPVKVYCDATIAFLFIVSETFAKRFHSARKALKDTIEHCDNVVNGGGGVEKND
uniref:deoxyhypusine synthase n=1 Tax=Romanomermis culicivorax TaxID=13658 RepID=A0A915K7V3_ROMCU